MQLTQEQLTIIKKWLDAHIPNYHCPLCPSRKYTVNDIKLADSQAGKPIVQLVCSECAYIMNFESEPMGLL